MARVDVYVPDDQLDEASYVLLVTEVDSVLDDDPPRRVSWSLWRVVAAVLLFAVLAAAVGQVVSGADAGHAPTRQFRNSNGQVAPSS
jgi:heme A synthase